jgi:broad specificity phosphatase PhoE
MVKTVHFVRHAQGFHNEATERAGGYLTPIEHSTPDAWRFLDSGLTPKGVQQCLAARDGAAACQPALVVVSPMVRALQTAHLMFGRRNIPFLVHHTCRERWGRYTCDKRKTKTEIVAEMGSVFADTGDAIDFESHGFPTEDDVDWTLEREPSEHCIARGLEFVGWLAQRPESEIAVITHGSFLRHLFSVSGWMQPTAEGGSGSKQLLSNTEVRTVTLVN